MHGFTMGVPDMTVPHVAEHAQQNHTMASTMSSLGNVAPVSPAPTALPVTSLAAAPAPQPSESLGQSISDIFSQQAAFIPLPRFANNVSQECAMQNEGME